MVNRGMHLALWLALMLLGSGALAAEPRLWLAFADATDPTAELGRPISLELLYEGPADLDQISLEPWQADFALDRGYARRDQDLQRLRVRLTPRRSGMLELPPLQLGSASTATQAISVSAAQEDAGALQPHWQISRARAWQREELRSVLSIELRDVGGHLAVEDFAPPGFRVTALPRDVEPLADGRQRHRFAWLLRPLDAGTLSVDAPLLRYIRDGVPRRRFHFPLTTLQVDPLPGYVPPTVAVGRIAAIDRNRVSAEGIGAKALAETLQRAGLPAATSERRDGWQGTQAEARIRWDRAEPSPGGALYFEPRQGRLRAFHAEPPPPAWLHWSWLVIPALLLAWAAWRRAALIHALRLWHYRHALLQRLGDGGGRRALLAEPLPGDTSRPRTLAEWARGFTRCYRLSPAAERALRQLTDQLTAGDFAARPPDPDTSSGLARVVRSASSVPYGATCR
jgi:hypothetical protein